MTFIQISSQPIDSLSLELVHFRHQNGLDHYHLDCADEHRSCNIAFRTPIEDHTGIAHVLEHSVLCGSQDYPVRDPFFMMIRRSMQTFMNAMTGQDCTWYPFATLNEQDFYNLFSVYSDAVFRPHLHTLDIAQEAHRLSQADDGSWSINGVVYNEMKGDSSDVNSLLYQELCSRLLPDTCYRFNSGGDPADIPLLNPETIKEFHQKHYHPANACLCTYGSLDTNLIHTNLEQLFQKLPHLEHKQIEPPALQQQRFEQESYTLSIPDEDESDPEDEDGAEESVQHSSSEESNRNADDNMHLICAWLWGDATDPVDGFLSDICEELLFGHAGAALRNSLESSGLCRSFQGSGYMDYCRNGIMSVEAHGCSAAQFSDIFQLIEAQITNICETGFTASEIETAIKHIEMQERYIGGDHEPHGLQLCDQVISAWNYHLNPHDHLDTDRNFKKIRQDYQANPNLFVDLMRERFITHKQQVRITTRVSYDFDRQLQVRHDSLVQTQLTQYGEQFHQEQSAALKERQQQVDDPSILPKVELSDILSRSYPQIDKQHFISCPSNGLTQLYFSHAFNSKLDLNSLSYLRLFNTCIGQLGHAKLSYQESAALVNKHTGDFSTSLDLWMDKHDTHLALHAGVWGLEPEAQSMLDLCGDYLSNMRFDETERIKELAKQSMQNHRERLISNGNTYASFASMAACSPVAQIRNQIFGIPQIKNLQKSIADITSCAEQLSNLHQHCDWENGTLHYMQKSQTNLVSPYLNNKFSAAPLELPTITDEKTKRWQAYTIGGTVNYAALSLPTCAYGHADAAALCIAGYALSNAYLHTHIREAGGAYGASAYYNPAMRCFSLSTFRDPQIDKTFAAMHDGLLWLQENSINAQVLEEAIISAVSEFDRPESPFSETKRRLHMHLHRQSLESWLAYRAGILAVTAADVQRVSHLYLQPEKAYHCILGSHERINASQYNWDVRDPLHQA